MNIHQKYRKIALLIILQVNFAYQSISQQSEVNTDFLRSTGKIYSVVVIVILIFLVLIGYIYRIDNKLTKLENHIKNE